MRFILMLIIAFACVETFAQTSYPKLKNDTLNSFSVSKASIDFQAINNWQTLGSPSEVAINKRGEYVAFSLENAMKQTRTLIVRSIDDSWVRQFPGVTAGRFSEDGNEYIYTIADTLFFLPLGERHAKTVTNVISYQEIKGDKFGWAITQFNPQSGNDLLMKQIGKNKQIRLSGIHAYDVNKAGDRLLVSKQTKTTTGECLTELLMFKLPELQQERIWSSGQTISKLTNFSMDAGGLQVLFSLRDSLNGQSIWYYNVETRRAIVKVNQQSKGMESGVDMLGIPYFSENGKYIMFDLRPSSNDALTKKVNPKFSKVDVWSYHDPVLQSQQLVNLEHPELDETSPLQMAISVEPNSSLICVNNDGELTLGSKGDYIICKTNKQNYLRPWLKLLDSTWVVSLRDGSRQKLPVKGYCETYFSPDGRYLVYYDAGSQNEYFSYDLTTGKTICISSGIPTNSLAMQDEYHRSDGKVRELIPFGVAGWVDNGKGLLVYDLYDIWQLDPSGKNRPVNITGGYGRKHQIKLQISEKGEGNLILNSHDEVLLTAFNTKNKHNGFYKLQLRQPGEPKLLTMGPWTMDLSLRTVSRANFFAGGHGMPPLKASKKNVWVIKKQTASEAANYFITTDFQHLTPVSNLRPQKEYNWLTTELVHFPQMDGTTGQGVLYKPENFDSTKKYPIIITYYEQLTQRMYQFPFPEYTGTGAINIPWFVSRGYLVFTTDIYFTPGKINWSAWNTVQGAGLYLKKLNFINEKCMGICGHSFGGGETNYIVTHSDLFAAVLEGAGVTDKISSALQLHAGGDARLGGTEGYFDNVSIWDNPGLWLSESPIMKADKVTSPLLIFHCKKDGAVPWEQAVEFFVALRRLNKKVWMLQYDQGGHYVTNETDLKDFTTRATQYFDHYLKECPAPIWMTRGIRASMKGFETGYELDPSGNCGREENKCKVCSKWNEQYRRTPDIFSKPFGEWYLDDSSSERVSAE